MTFRLEQDSIGVLVLDWPYIAQGYQDSGPPARPVVTDRPGADGVVDGTSVVGARALTLSIRIASTVAETRTVLWDRLARYLHPGLLPRPRLVKDIECGEGAERWLEVRGASLPQAVNDPFVSDHAVSLVSTGSSYWQSPATQTVEVEPGSTDEPGFTFPVSFPLSFGGSSSEGSGRVDATSGGSAPASLVTRIYGPCVGPSVRNLTTGGRLDFPGLSLGSGNFLELDSSVRSARENGSAGANRLKFLDFATRVWSGLTPGLNELRFVVASSGSGCRAEFMWQDHYL